MTELMKQRQFNPMSVAEMAVSLFAAENGYLDEIPVEKIQAYEQALLQYMHSDHQPLMDTINSRGRLRRTKSTQGLASALNQPSKTKGDLVRKPPCLMPRTSAHKSKASKSTQKITKGHANGGGLKNDGAHKMPC